MRATTTSFNASNPTIKSFEKIGGDVPVTASPKGRFEICELSVVPDRPAVPDNFVAIEALVKEREADPKRAAALAVARRELANEHREIEGNTVRSRRLELGYSQVKLAELVSTSQSHIARIERGTENVNISTCRKLCAALQIDMNTLDSLLHAQEQFAGLRGR
jgi:DNA-binding XRE family transcriptional regulator